MKKKEIIKVAPEHMSKLRNTGRYTKFGEPIMLSLQTVYNALAYKTNSEEAARIRKEALTLYGGIRVKTPVFTES